ncbi:hypothetical protein UFOVP1357_27 [uncultured Caudovirales phage]|uniref:Uncharacterized protein n=1 Tax=uncultured Caudovirales phage TaxID=2100421 RepID=A0A6J5MIU9_9CAUD|nr:hypothetical protein UFOVP18_46 [uncultured Caudovirales phage]CAB4127051.1 hypothetical protein UFOVP82_48 [uncultured Caudovirales phage]CAB4132601.1 hypothetical protein UFOVP258_39 [uncultured Caudovirales phage]CAB4146498.1 hypothetical protein UFOVP502_31 [uncultured Caudovirales phage]CAB4200065.1 hypothetical protein UFOVP1357_27 [uncultured Caudovirales phage]
MGCLDLLDDLHEYQERIDDARFDLQKQVSSSIKQFVNDCLYEDFLEMIISAYINGEQVYEDVWVTKLKLTHLHRVAMFSDFKDFEKAFIEDMRYYD